MTKFKVGDKVKCLHPTIVSADLEGVSGYVDHVHSQDLLEIDYGDCAHTAYIYDDGVVLVTEEEEENMTNDNFIKVGETYKSLGGDLWTCIHTEGNLAWCKSGEDHTAYVFKTNGTPVSFGAYSEHTLVPNKTVVEVFGSTGPYLLGPPLYKIDTHKITFELDNNGEPVVDTVKMKKL